jgi:hypothetical protein
MKVKSLVVPMVAAIGLVSSTATPSVRAVPPQRIGNFRRVFVQALELLLVPAKEVFDG